MSDLPTSLAAVIASVDASISDLAALRPNDPAMRDAVIAVKLASHTLRSFWVPTLAEMRSATVSG